MGAPSDRARSRRSQLPGGGVMAVCCEPGCPELAFERGRCQSHRLPPRGRPHRRASQHVMSATHCTVCEDAFTSDNPPTRGHIVARVDGGTNDPSNYRAECARCNYGRAAA